MAIDEGSIELSQDEEDAELLHNVEILLAEAGVKNITGIGPIDDERTSVSVLVENLKDALLPDSLKITLSTNKAVTLKLVSAQDETPAVLLAGPNPQPWQYSGPLMGGDPIWNDTAQQWGTIAFAVAQASAISIEGRPCSNQSLTCSHVLDFPGSSGASTTNYPGALTVQWLSNPPVGGKWIDLAGARMAAGLPFTPLQVRGLGLIKGVVQPRKGIRVSKYGATTGLTSGRDLGWTQRKLSPNDRTLYWVRRVGGFFADVGDSGAPVMDADRNLVGLVVSGKPGVRNETYYIQALPAGQSPLPRVSAAAMPNLSCFVVDGF